MNKKEAEIALQQGHKIKHEYYSDNEYIFMVDDVIFSEEGYSHGNINSEFWIKYQIWDSGWDYYNKIVPQEPAKEKMYTKAEVKQFAFYAVQYASKLEAAGQKSIHKTDIDNYLDLEM
jgi:hypothetical protein